MTPPSYTYLALAALAVLAAYMLWNATDEEGFGEVNVGRGAGGTAWVKPADVSRTPSASSTVQNAVNRKVAQYIKAHWTALKRTRGFDKSVDQYIKWYGRGNATYGCNRGDGSARNYQLCKRWTKLNRKYYRKFLKDVTSSLGQKRADAQAAAKEQAWMDRESNPT